MKFYHGTTHENWEKIKAEGVLWGISSLGGYRHTYLTPRYNMAKFYGNCVLEVEYEPVGIDGRGIDNYGFNPPPGETCWQFSVFIPIPIKNVRKYKGYDEPEVLVT